MIHYTCDRCHRPIDPDSCRRYEVKIDVQTFEHQSVWDENEDDRDYLHEIHEALESEAQLDATSELHHSSLSPNEDHEAWDESGPDEGKSSQDLQFDLCETCYEAFCQNPMGRELPLRIGFSQN